MKGSFKLPPIDSLMPSILDMPLIISVNAAGTANTITSQAQRPMCQISTKKCKFTPEEDRLLCALIQKYGTNWTLVSQNMLSRNPRQCRERWNNYINPNLKADPWTIEEDRLLVDKYAQYGSHWSKIAKFFANRSDNSIRNRWLTLLRQSEKRNTESSSQESD